MRILSLDPSSTCCGWAVLDDLVYVASGRLRERKDREGGARAPYFRIAAMCAELRRLCYQYKPERVVIEWTSGKVGVRHTGKGAGLAVYGVAVGALWREAENWFREMNYFGDVTGSVLGVDGVLENEWTRRCSKVSRMAIAKAHFPQYDAGQDLGGDEADALLLGDWYQREQILRTASSERTHP